MAALLLVRVSPMQELLHVLPLVQEFVARCLASQQHRPIQRCTALHNEAAQGVWARIHCRQAVSGNSAMCPSPSVARQEHAVLKRGIQFCPLGSVLHTKCNQTVVVIHCKNIALGRYACRCRAIVLHSNAAPFINDMAKQRERFTAQYADWLEAAQRTDQFRLQPGCHTSHAYDDDDGAYAHAVCTAYT